MKIFDPKNWYWHVGGDQSQAYSSAAGNYVQSSDATFQVWLADGTLPTNIDTEANLGAVLAPYLQRPAHAGILDGYQEAQTDHTVMKLVFKLLFNMNNDIRVLKGQQPLTAAQARAYVKGLM